MLTCIKSVVQELLHSVYRPLYDLACSYLRYDLRGKSLYSLAHEELILLAATPRDTSLFRTLLAANTRLLAR